MRYYKNATIITLDGENRIIREGALAVEDGKIAEVGPASIVPASAADVVDLKGKTIVPGLVNAHIHFTLRRSFGSVAGSHKDPATLAFRAIRTCLTCFREGVTAARDMGHKDEVHEQLRDAIRAGIVAGPRIRAAGNAIVMSYGHAHYVCHQVHGTEELAKEIRRQINSSVDFIKIIASHDDLWHLSGRDICRPWFSLEDLKTAADLAHLGGLKITAHANGAETIHRVIEAGFDCIEHGIFLDEEAAVRMKERGMFLVPTLSGYRQNSDPFWNRGENWTKRYAMLWEAHREGIRHAVKHGVKLAAGTDTLGGMAEEIELLHEAGLTPLEALRAATINGAELMGLADGIGTLEAGKYADFLVLDADPLENVGNLRELFLTVKGGVEYSPAELDKFIPASPLYA